MSICTFIGHRHCPETIRTVLRESIMELIKNKGITRFYVGTHGEFDRMVYEVLCEIEFSHRIDVYVVLAYINRTEGYLYYDCNKTIFPDVLTKTPARVKHMRKQSAISGRWILRCRNSLKT